MRRYCRLMSSPKAAKILDGIWTRTATSERSSPIHSAVSPSSQGSSSAEPSKSSNFLLLLGAANVKRRLSSHTRRQIKKTLLFGHRRPGCSRPVQYSATMKSKSPAARHPGRRRAHVQRQQREPRRGPRRL